MRFSQVFETAFEDIEMANCAETEGSTRTIHPSARVMTGAFVDDYVQIEANVDIGANAVVLGSEAQSGRYTVVRADHTKNQLGTLNGGCSYDEIILGQISEMPNLTHFLSLRSS
jgi:UDP-3-O-[3-hydroxymyristoyl] glucosamine N-acyltransferase